MYSEPVNWTDAGSSRFEFVKNLEGHWLGANNAGIFLVKDVVTGRLCIEKRLRTRHIREGYAKREIEILQHLQHHPNISQLVHFDLQDQLDHPSATIWTEYCNTGSLDDFILEWGYSNERIAEPFLWWVFGSLAEAVRCMQRGDAPNNKRDPNWNITCHRDIQPSNVFLTSEGQGSHPFPRVVLGDFGCSTTLKHMIKNPSESIYCSRQDADFMPPEAPRFNLRSDVYQIGMVIYCLMFAQRDPGQWTDPAVRIKRDGHYSVWLNSLVCECLEIDPKKRVRVEEVVATIDLYEEMELDILDPSWNNGGE